MKVLDYECITEAGLGFNSLMQALYEGRPCAPSNMDNLSSGRDLIPGTSVLKDPLSFRQKFLDAFTYCAQNIQSRNEFLVTRQKVGPVDFADSADSRPRIGLILCSTKGILEDSVWAEILENSESNLEALPDTFTPILDDLTLLIETTYNWKIARKSIVSNACSSTHVGLELAQLWSSESNTSDSLNRLQEENSCQTLNSRTGLDGVILCSGDFIGPFISKGFQCLKLVASESCRPFAKDRDGLRLGSAAGMVFLSFGPLLANSSEIDKQTQNLMDQFVIDGVVSRTEGTSLVRPSAGGLALEEILKQLSVQGAPSFILAHGTGTVFNDEAEAKAFSNLYSNELILSEQSSKKLSELSSEQPEALEAPQGQKKISVPNILGAKWCVGHSLGASGLIDLIAAVEVLKRQMVFKIATTDFKNSILPHAFSTESNAKREGSPRLESAFVTSLGFGGVHAALRITKNKEIGVLQKKSEAKKNFSMDPKGPSNYKLILTSPIEKIAYQPIDVIPTLDEPKWSAFVDRWRALDQVCLDLADCSYAWNLQNLSPAGPDAIVFQFCLGSWVSDLDFGKSVLKGGIGSPSKFIYTLPNIPLSVLLQVNGWKPRTVFVMKNLSHKSMTGEGDKEFFDLNKIFLNIHSSVLFLRQIKPSTNITGTQSFEGLFVRR